MDVVGSKVRDPQFVSVLADEQDTQAAFTKRRSIVPETALLQIQTQVSRGYVDPVFARLAPARTTVSLMLQHTEWLDLFVQPDIILPFREHEQCVTEASWRVHNSGKYVMLLALGAAAASFEIQL